MTLIHGSGSVSDTSENCSVTISASTNALLESDASSMSSQFVGSVALGFCFAGFVAFIGNSMLIYTFCRLRRLRKKAANIFTIHLASNNGFLSVMALRIGVKMFWNLGAEDALSCQAEGFLLSTIHMNVMLTIAAMFAERYVVICNSGSHDSWLSICHYHPLRVVILIWLHSSFWAFWPLTRILPDYRVEDLIPCCIFDRFTPSVMNVLYLTAMSLSAFILPLLLACFTMNRVLHEVKKSYETVRMRRGRRHVTQTRSVCSGTDGSFEDHRAGMPDQNDNTDQRKEEDGTRLFKVTSEKHPRVARTISDSVGTTDGGSFRRAEPYSPERAVLRSSIILISTFAVSWTPFLLVCLVNLGGVSLNRHLVIIAYFLAKASCFHSAYAYSTHHHFKATMKHLTCK